MYLVCNFIPIAEDHRDDFEERFLGRMPRMREQPGLRRVRVMRPDDRKGPPSPVPPHYMVEMEWDSLEDFQNWMKSDHFKEVHRNKTPEEWFAGQSWIGFYRCVGGTHEGDTGG